MYLLVGDVGGTKIDLAVFDTAEGLRTIIVEETFSSRAYPSLEAVVEEFLDKHDYKIENAGFGVAGPVVGGMAKITNLPWVMQEAHLEAALNFASVRLLNDLAAIAYSVPYLEPEDLHTLNEGRPVPGGAIAVVAPGTGLGEAFLTVLETHYMAHASEGGHADFAPTDDLQIALLDYLNEHFDHVSYERICSGSGLPNIYDFFKTTGRYEEPPWLREALEAADDPTPVIVETALDPEKACDICKATLDIFVSVLGAEAGNLALTVVSTGGVYLGGGIPPRILPALEAAPFLDAFLRKGRLSHLLAPMPVHVILNKKAPLLGTVHYLLDTGVE
jgi:glucokinase